MSWFTVGEIVGWLVAAAVLGVVLGWLLHELWDRARRRRRARATPPPAVVDPVVAEPVVPAPDPVAPPVAEPVFTVPVPAGTVGGEGSEDLRIKGNGTSMIYHTPDSPAYERTSADVWFDTEDEAIAAGFRRPKNA